MSNVAIDRDGNEHYADNFREPYHGEYFCPNKKCGVKMILKNLGFEEKRSAIISPYFSAIPTSPHIDGCGYEEGSVSFQQLRESSFSTDDFFDQLLRPRRKLQSSFTGNGDTDRPQSDRESPITSVGALYRYCLQHSDSHELPDGKKVHEIYQEKRNASVWESKRCPSRLVRLNFRNCNLSQYDEAKGCYKIWCYFPHTENTVPPATFYTLGFTPESMSLMRKICNKLTPLKAREGELHIVVGGEWRHNHCEIRSKRQIFITGAKKHKKGNEP